MLKIKYVHAKRDRSRDDQEMQPLPFVAQVIFVYVEIWLLEQFGNQHVPGCILACVYTAGPKHAS